MARCTNGSATFAGGVIVAGGGFFFTRPLDSSAAVVEVTGLRRVRILADNVEVARTGRGGRALVPRLLPYLANRISFNESDIPFDYTVPVVVAAHRAALSWRRGREVHDRQDPGPHGVGAHGDRRPSTSCQPTGPSSSSLPGGPVESPLNAEGEFFLDLPDGHHHRATVTFQATVRAWWSSTPRRRKAN